MIEDTYNTSPLELDSFSLHHSNNKARIVIPSKFVKSLYKHFAETQQHTLSNYGFHKQKLPFEYIDKNFRTTLLKHIREFLLKYCVEGFLYEKLRNLKVVFTSSPKLGDISIDSEFNMFFDFELTYPEQIEELSDWRYLIFRPSQRKGYKDLDKQATLFLNTEKENLDEFTNNKDLQKKIAPDDWVCFEIFLIDTDDKPIWQHSEKFWLKISDEDDALPYREVFVGKEIDSLIISDALCLQEFFSQNLDTKYKFGIKILDIVPGKYFNIESFQKYFKIKTKKKTHQKLIEVFSFKNDLSLHRNIVEELFELCLNNHKVISPKSAILEEQQNILEILHESADYPVYRIQPGFERQIKTLADKQVKETILVDNISYLEDIKLDHEDIKHYLNLTQRNRTKEFIYFKHPTIITNDQEIPISDLSLKQMCLREKTLNHMINYLSNR